MGKVGGRRDVPIGVPLDLSTPTGMSCHHENKSV